MTYHHMTLTATTDEDGVYLRCACGWETNLGWDSTPMDAINVERAHCFDIAVSSPSVIKPGRIWKCFDPSTMALALGDEAQLCTDGEGTCTSRDIFGYPIQDDRVVVCCWDFVDGTALCRSVNGKGSYRFWINANQITHYIPAVEARCVAGQ